jgi:hypothetical protein
VFGSAGRPVFVRKDEVEQYGGQCREAGRQRLFQGWAVGRGYRTLLQGHHQGTSSVGALRAKMDMRGQDPRNETYYLNRAQAYLKLNKSVDSREGAAS